MIKPHSLSLQALDRALFPIANRKVTVAVSWILIALLIIDLLSSRQSILKFDDTLDRMGHSVLASFGLH
jgi:hypothetical protein